MDAITIRQGFSDDMPATKECISCDVGTALYQGKGLDGDLYFCPDCGTMIVYPYTGE